MGKQISGRDSLGYMKKDQKNYTRVTRQKKKAYGEAGCVLKYFSNQRLKSPFFLLYSWTMRKKNCEYVLGG